MIRFLICSVCVLGLASRATSQPFEKTVSIQNLVDSTLGNNPELAFYEAEIAAARANSKAAGVFPNPELSSTLGQKSVDLGSVHSEGFAWSVSLAQPFEWPG